MDIEKFMICLNLSILLYFYLEFFFLRRPMQSKNIHDHRALLNVIKNINYMKTVLKVILSAVDSVDGVSLTTNSLEFT